MITREDFLSIPRIAKELRDEKNRIEVIRGKLYSPRGLDTNEKVQSSGGQTALADVVIDLEQKLDLKEMELGRLQEQAKDAVLGSDTLSGEQVMLMILRYVDCAGWSEITETLHYSIATVYRMHRESLEIIFGGEA